MRGGRKGMRNRWEERVGSGCEERGGTVKYGRLGSRGREGNRGWEGRERR